MLVLDAVPGLSGVRALDNDGERSRNPAGEVEAGDIGTRKDDIEERAVSVSPSDRVFVQGNSTGLEVTVAEKGGSGYPLESLVYANDMGRSVAGAADWRKSRLDEDDCNFRLRAEKLHFLEGERMG